MELLRGPLAILSLLQTSNSVENFNVSFQISTLNELIDNAYKQQRIDTIAFFTYKESIDSLMVTVKPEIPRVIITEGMEELNFHTNSDFKSNILFVAVGKIHSNKKWKFLSNAFGSLESRIRGIFVTSSSKGLTEHFEWCWQKGFSKVLVSVADEKLFTYTPFPHIEVFELPLPIDKGKSYFGDRLSNLRGYHVRTAMQYDPPRVFCLEERHCATNDSTFVGFASRIYWEFLKYHNGVLRIIYGRNSSECSILNIIEQLNRGDIDLSMNPYLPYPGVKIGYPLSMMRWCIMVPARGELPSYAYFLHPFQPETWFACLGILFYLCFISALDEFIAIKILKKDRRRRRRSPDFGKAFTKMLRLMLFLPCQAVERKWLWQSAWNCVLVSIFGFVLSNLYLALVTSYLSNVLLHNQIDTLSEMVQLNISINIAEHEIPIVLKNRGLPKGFSDLLVPRKPTDLLKSILELRTDQAYVARTDLAYFAMEQEMYRRLPRVHLVDECITTIPIGFLMPTHSQFQYILDMFTLRCSAAGLSQLWYEISIDEGFRSGILKKIREEIHEFDGLRLAYFQFPFLILLGGILLALICFALEQFRRCGLRIWLKRNY